MSDKPSKHGTASRPQRVAWVNAGAFARANPSYPPLPRLCACGAPMLGHGFEAAPRDWRCCGECNGATGPFCDCKDDHEDRHPGGAQ